MKHISSKRALVLAKKYERIAAGLSDDIRPLNWNSAAVPHYAGTAIAQAVDTLRRAAGHLRFFAGVNP